MFTIVIAVTVQSGSSFLGTSACTGDNAAATVGGARHLLVTVMPTADGSSPGRATSAGSERMRRVPGEEPSPSSSQ
jgi:hypothetical protein